MNSRLQFACAISHAAAPFTVDRNQRSRSPEYAYTTHNPNYKIYKVYECSIEEARKIENLIKHFFKDKLSGASKEWFNVQPEEIDKIVATLLEKSIDEDITPAMHGINLSSEAYDQKERILEVLSKHKKYRSPESHEAKERMSELFSSSFKLGIPRHMLPTDIVLKDELSVDLYHCNLKSDGAVNGIRTNRIELPFDDNLASFYHLVKLASRNYIAVCTSRVSMPYLKTMNGDFSKVLTSAVDLGWHAFNYDDWSWHSPNETGLILYTQKTPLQKRLNLWEGSFRKWVIERSKLLEQGSFMNISDSEIFRKTISDICNDSTFPLHVNSAKELYDVYMEPFWGFSWTDREPHFMLASYKILFDKFNDMLQ